MYRVFEHSQVVLSGFQCMYAIHEASLQSHKLWRSESIIALIEIRNYLVANPILPSFLCRRSSSPFDPHEETKNSFPSNSKLEPLPRPCRHVETCGRRWSWSWLSPASEASCLRGTWHVPRRRSTFPRRRPCPPWRKKEGESSWKRTKGTACFPSRGGLPKWAVGNFSSFFFSFLPSSHGFRDEAYGGEGRMKTRFFFLEWRQLGSDVLWWAR